MGFTKDQWKCVHNGECSSEFYYRIYTFAGAFEIAVEDYERDSTELNKEPSILDEKVTTFPRLVILRPRSLSHARNTYCTKRILEYKEKRSKNDDSILCRLYEKMSLEDISLETRQIIDFSENCVFEISSEEDLALLCELRTHYGPAELLDSVSAEDQNIVGSLLEKDESGILVVNPWDNGESTKDMNDFSGNSLGQSPYSEGVDGDRNKIGTSNKSLKWSSSTFRSNELDFSGYSTATLDVFAIFGILSLFEEPFLLVASSKECSCVIYQNGSYKTINRVTKTLALPLLSCSLEEQFNSQEDKIINKIRREIPSISRAEFSRSSTILSDVNKGDSCLGFVDLSSPSNSTLNGEFSDTRNRNKEKAEWVSRVSKTLQKMSPIRGKKETFSSFLGGKESGSNWLSNSLINVSTGIIDSVTTAFSSARGVASGSNSISEHQNSNIREDACGAHFSGNSLVSNQAERIKGQRESSFESNFDVSLEELLSERKENLKLLLEGLTKMISSGGFYFSFDMDLTRTLQTKFENSLEDYNERVGRYCKNELLSPQKKRQRAYILAGDPRFIWNEGISLPLIMSGVDPRWITPLVQGYFCNQAIITSPEGPGYVKIGQEILSLRMNMINSFTDIDEFESSIQETALNRRSFVCKMCYEDHLDMLTRYDIVLFSRRSWERGGTRFNARGIDDNANVANFVESELQICINNTDNWFSFVQIRGSIPLFWEQTGVNSCSITCFDHDYSNYIFERHHQKLSDIYGLVIYVNLLGSSSHELSLSSGLKKEINYYNLNLDSKLDNTHYYEDSPTGLRCNCYFEDDKVNGNGREDLKCPLYCNCSYKASPIIYKSFDFHQQAKNLGFENALNMFVSQLATEIGCKIDYFHGVFKQENSRSLFPRDANNDQQFNDNSVTFANLLNLEDSDNDKSQPKKDEIDVDISNEDKFVILKRQKGVIRTNCLDCLDRTNALQWYVAWTWFVDLVISISTESVDCELDNHARLEDDFINYEYFMDTLFKSQLRHFGWFDLNPKFQKSQICSIDFCNVDKDIDLTFKRDEMGGSCQNKSQKSVLVNGDSSSKSSNNNTTLRSSLQIGTDGFQSNIKNPLALSKTKKRNSELGNKTNTNGETTLKIGERHSFLVKRRSDIQTLFTVNDNTNAASFPVRHPASLIGAYDNVFDTEQIPIGPHSSGNTDLSKKKGLPKVRGVFKKCLLNGMGIVTLKDSFSLLWAENGDVISELYTGAGSVFSGVIRNRKVSLSTNFDHALKSLRRLYHNAFEDSSRQQYIDCLLYRHPVNSNFEVSLVRDAVNTYFSRIHTHVKTKKSGRDCENLTVWVGTWNLAGQNPHTPIDYWVKSGLRKNTSIVCFCLQEIVELSSVRVMFSQNDKNREASFEMNAIKALGEEYVKLHSMSLVGLFCVLFIRKPLCRFVKSVESSVLKLGLMGNAGNKGAVVIRVSLHRFGTIAFTNVHLSSGEQNNEDRVSQLKMILHTNIFAEFSEQTQEGGYLRSGSSLAGHDLVILAGDFNFRLQIPRQEAFELLEQKRYRELVYCDQFIAEKRAKTNPFDKLQEESISFLPTYKFTIGRNRSYDQSRTPSWCDRILVYRYIDGKSQEKFRESCFFTDVCVAITNYRSDQRYSSSDHQPVSATITLKFSR